MRLIDADELADYITENEDDFLYALKYKDRNVLDGMILRIPTTYDIDKVVEQLTEYKRYAIRNSVMGIDVGRRMLEIVKDGGMDE